MGAGLALLVLPAKKRAQIGKGLEGSDNAVLPDTAGVLDNAVATKGYGVAKFDVRIRPDDMQWREGILFFGVEVVPVQGGEPWRVMKRYSDFYKLNQYLHSSGTSPSSLTSVEKPPWLFSESHGAFPRKHVFACEGGRLEWRRHRLEAWLQKVVRWKHFSWTVPVRGFLHSSPHGPFEACQVPESSAIQAGSVQASSRLPRTMEMTSLKPGPKPPVLRSFQGPGVTLQIQIPEEGARAGQSVPIGVPGGSEINFVLPSDTAGGSLLRLWFDRATSTLTSME
jgi:hypothetical protein